MIDNFSERLIVDFLTGNASEDDKMALKEWLSLSEENRAYFRQQWTLWSMSGSVLQADSETFDVDNAWSNMSEALETEERLPARWNVKRMLWRVAAVMLLLLIPAATYFIGRQTNNLPSQMLSMETYTGTRSKIVLADNTTVWLNSGSKIECEPGFGADNRNVKIYGEGYFEVARNEKIPFIVETHDVSLRVLGTKFNVRSYDYDNFERIDLIQGKVKLNAKAKEQEMTLVPNERMIFDRTTGTMRKESFNVTEANLWVSEQLFFNEKPLGAIAADLSRIFGVKVTARPSVSQKKFYGLFNMENTTLDDVLNAIVATHHVKLEKHANEYILY